VHSALSWLNCSALTGSGRCCQVGMAGAAESFGAGRGSGTEPDGKGAACPSEAPSEAQAASTKPPNRIATNPRICPDMFPTDQYDAGMPYRKAPHIVDLQQRKNTARISWSHKIERLWQFNHRYFWRMTSSKYTLGDARMPPGGFVVLKEHFLDAIIPRCGSLLLERPRREAASGHAMSAPGQPGNAIDVDAWGHNG